MVNWEGQEGGGGAVREEGVVSLEISSKERGQQTWHEDIMILGARRVLVGLTEVRQVTQVPGILVQDRAVTHPLCVCVCGCG